jgi:hypothetical protein
MPKADDVVRPPPCGSRPEALLWVLWACSNATEAGSCWLCAARNLGSIATEGFGAGAAGAVVVVDIPDGKAEPDWLPFEDDEPCVLAVDDVPDA